MADLSPYGLIRSARRAVTDPRLVGVARALPRSAAVLNRARAPHGPGGVPGVRLSAGLAAQVVLDEVMISVMRDPKLMPHGDDYVNAARDIRDAYHLFAHQGWLAEPESFHIDPPVPERVTVSRERAMDVRYEHLSFASGFEPHAGIPGRGKWLSHRENRTAHAWLLRHADPSAPWLVGLHGFGMGQPMLDLRAFRAAQMHRNLGINQALVVLPLHGPRQIPGSRRGEGFMSVALVDSLHGFAQTAWDTRSVIRWIRSTSGPDVPIGVHGVSLGGYSSALVASLESGLACAIAGIPATDIPDLFLRHSPPHVRRRALETGALGPEARSVHSVVSPLVLKPKVARPRRYIFAGVGDRMSTAVQARRLWEHWDRPSIEWYPGGHIGFFMTARVQRYVTAALTESGLVKSPPGPPGELPMVSRPAS
jgi:hypothetical protein